MPLPSRMRAWCCPAMRVGSACGEAGIVPDSTIPARIIPHARHDMTDHDTAADTTAIEAAAFRRLLQHLARDRADVQNIDLMIGAGFCRNCLADWYREAAEARGLVMTRDEARKAIYGEPFAQWKARSEEHTSELPSIMRNSYAVFCL